MGSWQDLDAELALWRDAGEVPTFWWRDDDTQAPTDDLDRLIAMAERYDAPLHLAVVPADIGAGLADRLRASPLVYATQHGFSHTNHEAKGTGASEVGVTRDIDLQIADLREGWARMQAAALPNLLPVFVPPWNRIADKTLPHLVALGYVAVSTGGPRPHPAPVAGLQHVNCQIDPIHWKQGARLPARKRASTSVCYICAHGAWARSSATSPLDFARIICKPMMPPGILWRRLWRVSPTTMPPVG